MDRAFVCPMPGVRRFEELIAWQLADEFAAQSVPTNIAEGFRRFAPREFMRFLDYSIASLGEAELRLKQGIRLGYFRTTECTQAFTLARRCLTACIRLKHSQRRFLEGR